MAAQPFGSLGSMQPPEEPTDDVSVRLDWPVQDAVWDPVDGVARRRRRSRSSSRSGASADQAGGSSDLLPARIEPPRQVPTGDEPAAAVEELASRVERLATMVEKLEERLAAPVPASLPTEIVRRLDDLLGQASDLRAVQDQLAAVIKAREEQESELVTSANQLAEDLKAVRKQIPVAKRAGGRMEDGTVERIADAIRQAMEQPPPKPAKPAKSTRSTKSTRKASGTSTATRRSKRAS